MPFSNIVQDMLMLLFEKNTTLSEQVQKNTTVGTGKKKTTLSEQVQSRIEKL